MRAIQMNEFGDPQVMRFVDVPVPEPAVREVRVKLHAAGVNPAEAYIRTGTYAFFKPDLPYTPGFDGAGTVDCVGPGVTHVKAGDRVFVASLLAKRRTGTYAEYVVCDADSARKLPDNFSYAQGAAIGVPGHAAYRALFQRGDLRPSESVLIHGASGGVGTLAVQMARAHGAFVIGTCGNDESIAYLKQVGVHEALNHSDPGHYAKILNLTGNAGVNVIMESLANVNLEHDAEIIAKYGRIVVVGNRGSVQFTPRLLMMKEASVLGMALWNSPAVEYSSAIAALSAMLESGVLRPSIGREYPLEQAVQSHIDVLEKASSKGKIILNIT